MVLYLDLHAIRVHLE